MAKNKKCQRKMDARDHARNMRELILNVTRPTTINPSIVTAGRHEDSQDNTRTYRYHMAQWRHSGQPKAKENQPMMFHPRWRFTWRDGGYSIEEQRKKNTLEYMWIST